MAAVPVTYGAVRPVIVLPASVMLGLDPAQLEAILAHEMAHIARHDFLMNCLQVATETLLFYHPAVWLLSRFIRHEREVCCDALAAQVCGDPVSYSRVLLRVEELRWEQSTAPALGVSGSDLRSRIERLLAPHAPDRSGLLPAMLVLAAVLAGAGGVGLHAQQQTPSPWDRWLNEDVVYIISQPERDAFLALKSDPERQRFSEQFWERRGGEVGKEEHYLRIQYANLRFEIGDGVPGWQTDRGRVYITYGPPAQIESHADSPQESWRYGDGRQYDFSGPQYKLQKNRNGIPLARIILDRLPKSEQDELRSRLMRFTGQPMSNELMDAIRGEAQQVSNTLTYSWRLHRETGDASVELSHNGSRGAPTP